MKQYNIIGDVGGRFDELMALIELMPKGATIVLVGDLVDRGPDSYKVVEWAKNTSNVISLKGNHEDMMIEAAIWGGHDNDHSRNGGLATLKSYGVPDPIEYPKSHIKWMNELPIFLKDEGLFVSHAPWKRFRELGDMSTQFTVLWNRIPPSEREGVFQVYGHNHKLEKHISGTGNYYGICIDSTASRRLSGIHWPSKEDYYVPFKE